MSPNGLFGRRQALHLTKLTVQKEWVALVRLGSRMSCSDFPVWTRGAAARSWFASHAQLFFRIAIASSIHVSILAAIDA